MKKTLLLGLLAGLAIGAGSFFGVKAYEDGSSTQAKAVAQRFIDNVLAGKMDEAYSLTSAYYQKAQPKANFSSSFNNLKSNEPFLYLPALSTVGSTAYYSQEADGLPKTSNGRTNGVFILGLSKIGIEWKIDSVAVR
jgi:hypothetical protein